MGHRDAQHLGGDGAGHGRSHVAQHQAQTGRGFLQQALVARHDGRRLLGLGAGAHLQVHVRRRDAQLLKEGPRQAGVIVLAGMHQPVAQGPARRRPRLLDADERGDLHEVRPGAGDQVDEHGEMLLKSLSRLRHVPCEPRLVIRGCSQKKTQCLVDRGGIRKSRGHVRV